jgi:hypothetical protein
VSHVVPDLVEFQLINLIDEIPPELKALLQKAGKRTRTGLWKTIG